jgi:hypothetical protein
LSPADTNPAVQHPGSLDAPRLCRYIPRRESSVHLMGVRDPYAQQGEDRHMVMETADAAEVADKIQEATEGHATDERFRQRAAIAIGIMAMLLAITGLGGGNATKEMLNANIQASDTYAFYQAKSIRQTSNQLSAQELEALLLTQPSLPADARGQVQQRIQQMQATVARYESEPSTGEGKQELLAKAQAYEQRRDRAAQQDPNFDFAQAFLQIGIVLGSVSIVASSRQLLGLGLALGGVATLLMLNGFFLFFPLPIG